MENNGKTPGSHEISIPKFEANMRKALLVSSIVERAENYEDEEETNKGRS